MKIEIITVRENEDGSMDCSLELDEEGKDYLIRFAIVKALEQAVQLSEKEYTPDEWKSETSVGNTSSRGTNSLHGKSKQSRKSKQHNYSPEAA